MVNTVNVLNKKIWESVTFQIILFLGTVRYGTVRCGNTSYCARKVRYGTVRYGHLSSTTTPYFELFVMMKPIDFKNLLLICNCIFDFWTFIKYVGVFLLRPADRLFAVQFINIIFSFYHFLAGSQITKHCCY